MSNWPKHSDGSPMSLGEMSPAQRREQIREAAKRTGIFFEHPQIQERIAAIIDANGKLSRGLQ